MQKNRSYQLSTEKQMNNDIQNESTKIYDENSKYDQIRDDQYTNTNPFKSSKDKFAIKKYNYHLQSPNLLSTPKAQKILKNLYKKPKIMGKQNVLRVMNLNLTEEIYDTFSNNIQSKTTPQSLIYKINQYKTLSITTEIQLNSQKPNKNNDLPSIKHLNNQPIKDQIKRNLDWQQKMQIKKGNKKKDNTKVHFEKRSERSSVKMYESQNFKPRNTLLKSVLVPTLSASKESPLKNMLGISPHAYFKETELCFTNTKINLTKNKQLQKMKEKLIHLAQNYKQSQLMTQDRVQALYEAKLIRGTKRILGRKRYEEMEIVLQKQSKVDKVAAKYKLLKTINYVLNNKENINSLEKNYNRLKSQKKRFIERLKL